MSKIQLMELLQQDINDVKGLINFDEYGMSKKDMKKQARGIISNLETHLEEFVKLNSKK